jgi:hypothetical protein
MAGGRIEPGLETPALFFSGDAMRPLPPPHLADTYAPPEFRPAPELDQWARVTFIDEGAWLENQDHAHLRMARIGWLWTNVEMKRHGRMFLGQCERPVETQATWSKARGECQLRDWFDGIPDFVITIYAPLAQEMTDRQFSALIEHEMYHAAQAKDEWGQPKFSSQTGEPLFAMRAHDVEEFVGVVERYGATSPALATMAESVAAGPLFDDDGIAFACGACAKV